MGIVGIEANLGYRPLVWGM